MCRILYQLIAALARLAVRSGRTKDLEIIVLRHQLAVLGRTVDRPTVTDNDRSLLATIAHALPRPTRTGWLVTPDTLLRWHRRRVARHWTHPPRRPGRPATAVEIRRLVIEMAADNPTWGYRRIHGELAGFGHHLAASTVWKILKNDGIEPAPRRTSVTWSEFLHSQAAVACDFVTVDTSTLRRYYVLVFIDIRTRTVYFGGITANPTGAWTTQAARNLSMCHRDLLAGAGALVRDRGSQFVDTFDEVFRSQNMKIVKCPVRTPVANAYVERWIGTLRRELLDRTLIWNQQQLERLGVDSIDHYNTHRPHRSLQQRAPTAPEPAISAVSQRRPRIIKSTRCDGLIQEYRDAAQARRHFRHPQGRSPNCDSIHYARCRRTRL